MPGSLHCTWTQGYHYLRAGAQEQAVYRARCAITRQRSAQRLDRKIQLWKEAEAKLKGRARRVLSLLDAGGWLGEAAGFHLE